MSKKIHNLLTRYTCAYAQCAEGTSQPNGNQLCLTNYDSLDLAQYNCYLYKCDDLIQYEHNGSGELCLNFFTIINNQIPKRQSFRSSEISYYCSNLSVLSK